MRDTARNGQGTGFDPLSEAGLGVPVPMPPEPEDQSTPLSPGEKLYAYGGIRHRLRGPLLRRAVAVRGGAVIAFTVPGQPQGKGRPRIGRIGQHARMFTPAKTAAYEGLIAHAAAQALAGRPMLDGPVRVVLEIDCQVPASWSQKKQRQALAGELMPTTKPDVDNVVKAVFDGCNAVIWRDDVQVTDLVLRKRYSATPCVRVQAEPRFEEATAQRELEAA